MKKSPGWLEQTDKLSKWDYLLFGIVSLFCFVSFAHSDLMVTGNRSWLFYESGIRGFYGASYQWTGSFGANYMPTTFWLFALWNYPLKLLGFDMPSHIDVSNLSYIMWYKLLPALFYIASADMLFVIARQVGMSKNRARVCMFSFLTMPIAFFSQFIFSQYDSFTVFFMLAGMYFYLKDKNGKRSWVDHLGFCFSFGMALTCKYYVILIFAIFVLLDEKRIGRIIADVGLMLVPFFAEYLLYGADSAFQENVFGFDALDYASLTDFATYIGTASFAKVLCVLLAIWAYFHHPKDREEKIRWVVFLNCGMCFCLFGLMTFHPQWLIFAVPFWVLSAMLSERTEKYYWGNIVLIAVFYLFVFQVWRGTVDDVILQNGIWKYMIAGRSMSVHAVDVLPWIDLNTLYSIIIAIFLAFFVFSHPRNTRQRIAEDDREHAWLIRAQLVAAAGFWTLPCILAVFKDMQLL